MALSHYVFPWRDGNRFDLLVDGGQFFPAMLAAIDAAREYVLLEMYLIDASDLAQQFVDAFCSAAARGVKVYLLLDDYGTGPLVRRARKQLEESGVAITLYNPLRVLELHRNLLRDHRKLLLIDGEVAFVGGTGISADFDPHASADRHWRENMVRVEGPCVTDWQQAFRIVWDNWSDRPLGLPAPPPLPDKAGACGRVVLGNRGPHAEVKRSIINQVRRARARAWVATAYFIPSWKMRRALRHAASRGVDVRLLVPGPNVDVPGARHASRRYYGRLLRNGVRIFEYQPRFLHVKTVLCDDWVSIGSTNVDRWNMRWNLDANQEIRDGGFAARIEQVFRDDFAQSSEVTHLDWHRRPWYSRIAEQFWGRIDLLLARIGQARSIRHRRDRG